MIIEIKDIPKGIKTITISEIVLEFSDERVSMSDVRLQDTKSSTHKGSSVFEPIQASTIPNENSKPESLERPVIEASEPLSDIPEEMLNLEF